MATGSTSLTLAVVASDVAVDDDELYAINLQLEEIRSFANSGKQKYPEGKIPDSEVAAQDFQIELERHLLVCYDQRFARSIDKAVADDAVALRDLVASEDQALQDREIAQGLSDGLQEKDIPDILLTGDKLQSDSVIFDGLSQISLLDHLEREEIAGPSQTLREKHQQKLGFSASPTTDCVACRDKFHLKEILQAPCHDFYCTDCLKSLFLRATKDETLFPPRCCSQNIPLSLVEEMLTTEAISTFRSAAVEFTTIDRTYCAGKDCGRFIPSDNIQSSRAICPGCNNATCIYCKGDFHNGDCPEDEALQKVLALALGERWRRCFDCSTMIELNKGCNHITCKCSAEFCYACGVKWKQCMCDAWIEQNLINRAEEVVDRELDHPIAAPEFQRRIVHMQQQLLEHHECTHRGRWEKQEGNHRRGYRCEICDVRHWKYILRCRQCHITACEECRRHRI